MSIYHIVLGLRARKQLRKLPDDVRRDLVAVIRSLAENPRPPGVTKLRARKAPQWRVRSGKYRILYEVEDDQRIVTVYKVAHRKNAY